MIRVLPLSFLLATASTATAQTASGGLEALLACSSTASDAERLLCFDREAAALRARDVVAVPARDVEELRRESFGYNLPALERVAPRPPAADERKPETRSWTVQRVQNPRSGQAVFFMDDGQVWQQTDGDKRSFPEPGRRGAVVTATIRPAAFGSHIMTVRSDGKRRGGGLRVRRVR